MGLGVGPGAEVWGLTLCSQPMTSVEELPVPLRLEWSWCPKVAQRPLSLWAKQKLGWRATPTPREPPGALHHPRWRREAAQEAGAEPQGVPGHQSSSEKPEQSAKLIKQEKITLESTQAAVGLTLGVLFGKMFS